jgi:N-acetylmuramoyl-L-alanine amidase
MARYPGATWRELPENKTQPTIVPTQVVLHTAVGSGSVFGYFNTPGINVESQLWVGLDGRVEQYIDSTVWADAQVAANPRAISIETADNGHPDTYPWQPPQVESLAQIIAWASRVHGIPIRLCRNETDTGIGYHSLYKSWNPNAHSCPGPARIAQVPAILIRAQAISVGGIMATLDTQDLAAILDIVSGQKDEFATEVWTRFRLHGNGEELVPLLNGLSEVLVAARRNTLDIAALKAAVSTLSAAGGVDGALVIAAVEAAVSEAVHHITLTYSTDPIPPAAAAS